MAKLASGLVGVVSGLVIGAALFIYVISQLLPGLKTVTTPAAVNTSLDSMVTTSLTVGGLMVIAGLVVVVIWMLGLFGNR